MNPSKAWVALTAPVTMILALVVAIPLLFGGADCDPALASNTGPTSDAVSIMSWNVCASSCGGWNQRIAPATEQVGRISPDILAVQEGGWGKDKRAPTFKGFGGLGYANANDKVPFIGRYIFYKPAKFDASKSGSIDLGGNHGMAWVNLRTKADGVEFTVVDVHLAFEQSADAKRKTQMTDGLAKVQADSGAKQLVVVGDFNSNKSRAFDAPAAVMKDGGYSDAVTVATNKLNEDVNSARGRDSDAPVNRDSNQTDHIYVPAGSSVASWQQVVNAKDGKYTAPFITDHNAIMATIGLPGSKPANPVKPDSITTDEPKDAKAGDTKPGDTKPGDAKPVANVEPTTAPAAPPTTVGRWNADQLKNAAAIVAAGKTLGINQRGQTLAVMVAMGESSLQVIDRGDAAGPDSRGLFQQRDSWGTYEQRMDPTASATLFYQALLKVEGWADLQPTTAAHRVQRNADPNYYEKFWDDAVQVVASVTGQSPADAGFAAAPGCGNGEATDAVWASGADCDFGTVSGLASTPRSCTEALNEAARISRDSACTNEVRGGTWRRRCLEFVARTYGYASSGTPTAKAQFRLMESKGLISKSKEIPAGALVYFDSSDPAGHIAIYAGSGKAFSNDYVRPGCIDLTPMSAMGGNGRYLGWSPPVFPLGAPL